MDSEIKNFIKVWVSVLLSVIYCYFIVSKIPKGKLRLLTLLPIFYLFTILPLNLRSFHLGLFTTAYITWLANFKLLFFSFDQGPLSTNQPKPLLHFISTACLPIKIKQKQYPSLQSPQNINIKENPALQSPQNTNIKENPSTQITTKGSKSLLKLAIKALLLHLLVSIYDSIKHVDPKIILIFQCLHIYLAVELILALSAVPARALLGLELEQQFNEPYLSTSLQDFWSRRWNLMVSNNLRSTVYEPIRSISIPIVGRKWAPLIGVLFAFLVSGLMHELLFYYVTRADPTWEVTLFFVIQGIFTVLEMIVKRALGDRCRLKPWVSVPLTIGFVMVTGYWLFFPQLRRNDMDKRAVREYNLVVEFVKDKLQSMFYLFRK